MFSCEFLANKDKVLTQSSRLGCLAESWGNRAKGNGFLTRTMQVAICLGGFMEFQRCRVEKSSTLARVSHVGWVPRKSLGLEDVYPEWKQKEPLMGVEGYLVNWGPLKNHQHGVPVNVCRILGLLGSIKERTLFDKSKNCRQGVEQSRKEEGEGQTWWCSQHEILENAAETLVDLIPWLVQVVDLFRPFRLFMSSVLSQLQES